jgi:hypothetical protein
VPETNYGALKATVPKTGDYSPGGPDVPRAFREYTDSIGTGQGAGKLLIVQGTGAAAFKAMKGDGTLAEDGTLTLAPARKPVTWYTPKVIATEESRTNAAFGTLTTADEITGIVVPENGLMQIRFALVMKSSVANAGSFGLFIDGNQALTASGILVGREVPVTGTGFHLFASSVRGESFVERSPSEQTALPATGLAFGAVEFAAAAGTHTVSLRYKASEGTVTAKERKLWVGVHGV